MNNDAGANRGAGATEHSEERRSLREQAEKLESVLEHFLGEADDRRSGRVFEAMRYSLMAGGKRLRPLMLLLAYEACGGTEPERIRAHQAALEMIHTYSLIHDDLPAMDDDTYRRGRLTCHKAFDEATAVLAGDGLLNRAFEILFASILEAEDEEERCRRAEAARVIADAAGPRGMIAGQMADLLAEQRTSDLADLEYIESRKTGCLFKASFVAGALLAGADAGAVEAMTRAAALFGRAFQIEDDLLDLTGDAAVLGKQTGQDEKMDKTTFVSLYGLKEAEKKVRELSTEAVCALSGFENEAGAMLREWIQELIYRKK